MRQTPNPGARTSTSTLANGRTTETAGRAKFPAPSLEVRLPGSITRMSAPRTGRRSLGTTTRDERIAGRPSTTMPAIPPDVANPCAWGRNPTATGTHRITPIDSFAIRRDGTGRAIKGAPFVPRWEGIWPESLILGGGLIHEYSVAA